MKMNQLPLWLKISYSLMVSVIIPVYWVEYGWTNFLWFSDIALILLVPALWLESRFINSMMSVGALPFELVWLIGFFSGGALGIADYMFSDELPLYLRALSGFHFVLPPTLLYLLYRLRYEPKALPVQICLAWIVILATYFLTDPSDNINWVSGPGYVQDWMDPRLYLVCAMAAVTAVYIPTHLILKRLFK